MKFARMGLAFQSRKLLNSLSEESHKPYCIQNKPEDTFQQKQTKKEKRETERKGK